MRTILRAMVLGALVLCVGALGAAHPAAQTLVTPALSVSHARSWPAGRTAPTAARQANNWPSIARAPAALTCQAAQLSMIQAGSSGATGHIGLALRLRNVSAQACTLQGYATLVLLDAARRPLPTVLHWGPGGFFNFNRPVRLVTLAPGGSAYLAVGWAHIPSPGQSCPLAPNLLFLPPGASSALLVAMGRGPVPAYGAVDACGGQLAVSAVEPTPFLL